MRSDLPGGTVTFLFTDVEGSTRLLSELGAQYAEVLADHHARLRQVWAVHRGVEVDTSGDSFFVAFERAGDAVAAAAAAQKALADAPTRVRIGLHTGEPVIGETGYIGLDVHRSVRIAAVAHGGQVVLSDTTRALVDVEVTDLGEHRLKDLSAPQRLYQLGSDPHPPLNSLYRSNVPVQLNPLIGRGRELLEMTGFVRGGTRLLTLTGFGGSGKTRLALARWR